jgi:hypothetical protein
MNCETMPVSFLRENTDARAAIDLFAADASFEYKVKRREH